MSVKTEWTWDEAYQILLDMPKSIIKEDACMRCYDRTKPLYLETNASGVGLGASLLQTRSGTCSLKIEHQTTAYSDPLHLWQEFIKHKKEIQVHRKEGTRYTTQCQKVPLLLLHNRGEYNHVSQATSCNIQERCSNTTVNPPQNTPQQSQKINKPGPDLFTADWLSRKKNIKKKKMKR